VLGMLELLQQTPLNPEQRELTGVIGESASSLLKIIDDILDFSKIEAGKLQIERVPMSPLALVEGVADTMAPAAHKKKLLLTTYVDGSVPPSVEGDPVRLRQILFNLVGNAIKFTERGQVSVRVSVEAAIQGGMKLCARISDTGIGLSPEALGRLFQPFAQADDSTTRRFGGTGLGLSISRRLVERMGGEIGAESLPGQGSTFWFTMTVTPGAAREPDEADLTGLSIVLIEDNETVQEVLINYLAMKGVQVEAVGSAEAAISLLRRYAEASVAVDAIIVDLRLPGMDGFQFRRALEDEPELIAKPMILLTAYDDPGQRSRALTAGFSAYLTKPVRRSTLFRAIAEACGRAVGQVENREVSIDADVGEGPDRETALSEGRLILVSEDNTTNQLVILRQLSRLGYAADLAVDGRQALTEFEKTKYGLLITDVHMPEMDGLELTTAIRDSERATGRRRMPIIALTANVLSGEAERCLAAGMDDYLSKPVNLAQLRDTLARWLPRGDAPGPAAPMVARQSDKTAAVLDLERMREIFGDIDDGAIALLRRYVETTEPLVDAIGRTIAHRASDEARKVVHSAKGASRSAGAEEFAALCADLEIAIKAGDWDAAGALSARLGPAFGRVREAVGQVRI
jgi:two-component system, sensor histidine kinase and response regulator